MRIPTILDAVADESHLVEGGWSDHILVLELSLWFRLEGPSELVPRVQVGH
jgi:hypothetical protein